MDNLTEMLKGVLEGCVLQIIDRGETYGYEITSTLQALGFADVVEGTVYTILLRLEKNGAVSTHKRASTTGPPRKFYVLTDTGRARLASFWQRWDFISRTIDQLRTPDA
ncbi:PadR family transcriptional regulator [uncultured Pseudokineococcus sp.]|uniref:PadR family transcriptional regulator n=1 Tax=uncultured Pseudokineococcus sp. TaxID=1642928 RepID=UPI002612C582|nr:PadR family transcriptional regulator [uncultured Pseudokineococcus sp.]